MVGVRSLFPVFKVHILFINDWPYYRFLAQLTISRFRGDTAFGLIARIMSTFSGGLTGILIWYVFVLVLLEGNT